MGDSILKNLMWPSFWPWQRHSRSNQWYYLMPPRNQLLSETFSCKMQGNGNIWDDKLKWLTLYKCTCDDILFSMISTVIACYCYFERVFIAEKLQYVRR